MKWLRTWRFILQVVFEEYMEIFECTMTSKETEKVIRNTEEDLRDIEDLDYSNSIGNRKMSKQ